MKFNNYDELLTYLKDKSLESLEFEITELEPQSAETADCVGDCSVGVTDVAVKVNEYIDVQIKSLYDSPSMKFKVGNDNILIVESLNHIPNTCSTSEVSIGDRKILTSICEDEAGIPYIELFVEHNGNYNKKKFSLYTKDSGLESQISINE
mgnify:CR=1 FL=1